MKIHRQNRLGRNMCAHPRCSVIIAERFLMCLTHWNAVPMPLRMQIWAALTQYRDDPRNGERLHTLQRLQAEAIRLVS